MLVASTLRSRVLRQNDDKEEEEEGGGKGEGKGGERGEGGGGGGGGGVFRHDLVSFYVRGLRQARPEKNDETNKLLVDNEQYSRGEEKTNKHTIIIQMSVLTPSKRSKQKLDKKRRQETRVVCPRLDSKAAAAGVGTGAWCWCWCWCWC
ncbi:hypothetical protein M0804_005293 [Polistes exclamans]|nr:hypothetical protein M0804_005293 [Polistes exclamans]